MRLSLILSASVLALGLAGGAHAQTAATPAAAPAGTAYSADDVVKHFQSNLELGADRGLCFIGNPNCTEEAAAPAPKAFDMRVEFNLNSAELTPEARHRLDAFAEGANRKELRRAKFTIDGHTDARGGEEMNQGLSERRAEAVVSYLVARGVEVDRLTPRGFGKTKPLSANPLADENRRVEANILPID